MNPPAVDSGSGNESETLPFAGLTVWVSSMVLIDVKTRLRRVERTVRTSDS